MREGFFLFFGIGCMLGLAYSLVRYILPAIILGVASLVPGIMGLIQAGKEGLAQGHQAGKSPSGPGPGSA